MTSNEIRKKYMEFFESKGHKIIPSASLVPENDPSVLFTTAGMQQFKPHYIGKKNALEDFGTLNTASVQKCVRTSDIDEVGDESHLTFFEMLGNFSFGGYWKEEAIKYAHEFITSPKWMDLKIDYVSVFAGEDNVPADLESEKIWKSIDPNITVKKSGRADNFWGPTGEEGPCGPTTEIYVDGIEIWNIVFNEFYQDPDKTLRPLDIKGIDTGMGLERLTKVVQKVPTVFDTDLLQPLIDAIPTANTNVRRKRILSDHARTVSFLIADGVEPSNKDRGYVLRRLMRRMIAHEFFSTHGSFSGNDTFGIGKGEEIKKLLEKVIEICNGYYSELTVAYPNSDKPKILEIFDEENDKYGKALILGIREIRKMKEVDSKSAFFLFETFGLPYEAIKDPEISGEKAKNLNREDFEKEFEKHKEISRSGSDQKFKGGLGGHSEMEVKYHTATHLLRRALEEVLKEPITQKGSNITPERLRFDFGFGRKITEEEKKEVENLVNKKISEKLPVNKIVMKKEEAEKTGATHVFGEKYGDEVSIYYIGVSLAEAWSKEFCGGPHSANTGNLEHFKITKEESVSAGVRRIKAILE